MISPDESALLARVLAARGYLVVVTHTRQEVGAITPVSSGLPTEIRDEPLYAAIVAETDEADHDAQNAMAGVAPAGDVCKAPHYFYRVQFD